MAVYVFGSLYRNPRFGDCFLPSGTDLWENYSWGWWYSTEGEPFAWLPVVKLTKAVICTCSLSVRWGVWREYISYTVLTVSVCSTAGRERAYRHREQHPDRQNRWWYSRKRVCIYKYVYGVICTYGTLNISIVYLLYANLRLFQRGQLYFYVLTSMSQRFFSA